VIETRRLEHFFLFWVWAFWGFAFSKNKIIFDVTIVFSLHIWASGFSQKKKEAARIIYCTKVN